jgi:hypothetical protein
MDLSRLFKVLQSAASDADIRKLRAFAGDLPSVYAALLKQSDGLEACVHDEGGDCLAIWSVREVLDLNPAYKIARWCPTLLAIGSDGGGDAIGLDRQPAAPADAWPIVRIGFGNLDPAEFVVLAPSFQAWLDGEFRLRAGG